MPGLVASAEGGVEAGKRTQDQVKEKSNHFTTKTVCGHFHSQTTILFIYLFKSFIYTGKYIRPVELEEMSIHFKATAIIFHNCINIAFQHDFF